MSAPIPASSTLPLNHAGPAWRADLAAGVTNAILAVPQGVAFAIIAGVEPVHGLYAMIVPTLIATVVRDSPYVITGATNTSALVIGSLIASFAGRFQEFSPLQIMLLISLLMGLVQLGFAVLRLGALGRFVSHSVLVGFTCGATVLIAFGQLKNICGLNIVSSPRVTDEACALGAAIGHTDFRALTIAAATLFIVVTCTRISRLVPGPLIAVFLSGALVWSLGWDQGDSAIPVVGAIPRSLPTLTLPPFDANLTREVFLPSLALALLGIVEAISIGKALSTQARLKFHPNQELAAQGLGNLAGAFTGCMPSSASWTRSATNMQMGARTRWSGIVTGVTVLAIMLIFAPWARFVPTACLGALILWIAARMIDPQAVRYVWRWNRTDAAVMLITFLSMLCFEIQYAIYLGVLASLLLLIRRAGALHMVEMAESANGQMREIEIDSETGKYPIAVLQLEGDLFFGVVDELEAKLERIASLGARVIVVRLKRAHAIDATAAEALALFATHYKQSGGRFIFCGVRSELAQRIRRSHLGAVLGKENLLLTGETPFRSVQTALAAAKQTLLLGAGDSAAGRLIRLVPPELDQVWNYSI